MSTMRAYRPPASRLRIAGAPRLAAAVMFIVAIARRVAAPLQHIRVLQDQATVEHAAAAVAQPADGRAARVIRFQRMGGPGRGKRLGRLCAGFVVLSTMLAVAWISGTGAAGATEQSTAAPGAAVGGVDTQPAPEAVVRGLWAQLRAGPPGELGALLTDDVTAVLEGSPDFANGRIVSGQHPIGGRQGVVTFFSTFATGATIEDGNYQTGGDRVSNDLTLQWPYGTLTLAAESTIAGGRIGALRLISTAIATDPSARAFTDASAGAVISPKPELVMGEGKRIGDGVVQTWLRLDGQGQPIALGVVFTDAALEHLSTLPGTNYRLRLPPEAEAMAIRSLSFDWYRAGLPGAATQLNVPAAAVSLFLLHAYLMTPEEAQAISPADPQYAAKGARPILPENVHPDYTFRAGGAVPGNGTHLFDTQGPIFGAEPIQTGVNYSYYDGRWTTIEPFFALDFLRSKTDAREPLKLPEAYPKPGLHYPTGYAVTHDTAAGEYTIALDGFTLR